MKGREGGRKTAKQAGAWRKGERPMGEEREKDNARKREKKARERK